MTGEARERFVLIRPGALGDALLAFPALHLLRRARPDAHVTLVARADILPLAVASGLADATSPYDAPAWMALFSDEPDARGEAAAILDGALVIAYVAGPDGLVERNLALLGATRSVVVAGRPPAGSARHAALHVASALAGFGVPSPRGLADLSAALPHLVPPPADDVQADTVWQALALPPDRPVLAIHPGSGGAAKRWPPDRFAQLVGAAPSFGYAPLLIEGPADGEVITSVLGLCGDPAPPVARDLSPGALLALLRRCFAYLGNDSGATHLAAFADQRVVALFGPTDPNVWSPLGPAVVVLRSPTGHMDDLSASDVLAALQIMMATR